MMDPHRILVMKNINQHQKYWKVKLKTIRFKEKPLFKKIINNPSNIKTI